MGSKQRGKERVWETEHSLPTHYQNHYCKECSHFFLEFPDIGFINKNYCNKWIKKVYPSKNACLYFGFKTKPSGKRAQDRKMIKSIRTEEKVAKEASQRSRMKKIQETTLKPPDIVLSPILSRSRRTETTASDTPQIDGFKWPYKPIIPPVGRHSGGGGSTPISIRYGVPSPLAGHGNHVGSDKPRRKKKRV